MRRVLLVLAACHASSPTSPDLATRGAPAVAALDPAQLETDTRYLASDELAGRAPGTDGGAKAEQYIADRYRAIGLAPGGEHGTYFQTVPLREATLVDGSFVVHRKDGDLAFERGKEIVLRPWMARTVVCALRPVLGSSAMTEVFTIARLTGTTAKVSRATRSAQEHT
jgi:hypothetical protein